MICPFHLAIPVDNLDKASEFYGGILGCKQGRSDTQWIDWNFFGHQLVTHLVDKSYDSQGKLGDSLTKNSPRKNNVDGKHVPVPHFGAVLSMPQWHSVVEKLKTAKCEFVIEPYIRFEGQPGEQATCFLFDPAGNALEFKAFNNQEDLFAV